MSGYKNSITDINGNVGIGTDTPATLLHTVSSGNNTARIEGGSTNIVSLEVKDATNSLALNKYTNSHNEIRSTGNIPLLFKTNGNNEKMRITSGGDISFRDTSANEAFYWDASAVRLGIGTGSSPTTELEVKGITGANTKIRVSTAGNAGEQPGIQFYRNGSAYGEIKYDAGGNVGGESGLIYTDYRNDTSSKHIWKTRNVERMRLTSEGVVQATKEIQSPLYTSYKGTFTSSSGNWVNVHLLEQSEFRNRTVIASVYVNGTHSYASATINVMHNGGPYQILLGNKLGNSGADLRISGGYLQFFVTPWSAYSLYRLTVN